MDTIETLHGPTQKARSGNTTQLIIMLHGVGSDGNDLIGLAPMLAQHFPNAAFASPNAPFPYDMAPFGYQWFSLQNREEEALLAGVQKAAPILNRYIDEQMKQHGVTSAQTALLGFSQGTMTSLYTAPRREEALAGVVGFSGAMVGASKLAREVKSTPPVCLVHGQMDDVVPFAAMEIAERSLKTAGIEVESHARPRLGHSIDPEGMQAAVSFLQRVLG